MTPKQKAIELIEKFGNIEIGETADGDPYTLGTDTNREAKECAIIAVDEIISLCASGLSETQFWNDVKAEINHL